MFVKLRSLFIFSFVIFCISATASLGQSDAMVAQVTSSFAESFAGSISGDGRFVVFESKGNLATVNPKNADGNSEIFLWDFAQRRIFQITNTKSVLRNKFGPETQDNIKIEIVNKRPVISQNGRWIAFASNAQEANVVSTPLGSGSVNPGSFDGSAYDTQDPLPCNLGTPTPTPTATPTATPTPSNSPTPTPSPTSTPFNNPLQCDANMEIWVYEIPAVTAVDLNAGDEIAYADLSGGIFSAITNTPTSRYAQEGTVLRAPFVADDNHDASIDDDGNTVAFASTRDLAPCVGNAPPLDDNDEIFVWTSGLVGDCSGTGAAGIRQITKTLRGPIGNPIYQKNPTISGDGSRVLFASTGDDPIDDPSSTTNFETGSNPLSSRNEEIFYANLSAGSPTGGKQITTTTPTSAGLPVNFLEYGKRMSRNGNLIVFDSLADLNDTAENNRTNYTSFATYLYDVGADSFRRIGARSDADSEATGGDVPRYPSFTDYDGAGNPSTLLLSTRLNIKADGTVPTTESEGQNPTDFRPVQVYTYPLDVAPTAATFSRITKFPISSNFLAQTQALTSDTSQRSAFNFALTELGGGNSDGRSEVYYLFKPAVVGTPTITEELEFVTGASLLPIIPTGSPTPTPSPTATPTATPTPTPTPTPTATPTGSPTPTPTPITPAEVKGISQGMLARINFPDGLSPAVTPRTATGDLARSFTLPITLSGVSLSINGYACGIKSITNNYIEFVAPPLLPASDSGVNYPVIINNQGTVTKGYATAVYARPDVFSTVVGPGGRAQIKNVTNRVHTTEPFTATTVKIKGGRRVASVMRLRLTGVAGAGITNYFIKIGSAPEIQGTAVLTGSEIVEPGIYTVDFQLPPVLNYAGEVPIIVTIMANGIRYTSRLDDTAPFLNIL